MNFAPRTNNGLSDRLNELLDAGLECEAGEEKPRTYLGGSRIGDPCDRKLSYEYETIIGRREREKFPGRALRRFRMGHVHEIETARWLRSVDFDLQTEGDDGRQLGFGAWPREDGTPRLAGHFDGVIHDGPEDMGLEYPLLWEHKIMKHSSWTLFQKSGLRAYSNVYFAQVQVYMFHANLGATLFTALDTDTSRLAFEAVKFDEGYAIAAIDRALSIITGVERGGGPGKERRIASSSTDYRCKFCPFSADCWKLPKPDDAPTWAAFKVKVS